MNQYKRLLSNTFIFAVGTFSSKILVIFKESDTSIFSHIRFNYLI